MFFQKIFLLVVLASFSFGKLENEKIEVIGKAMNAKLGAVIITDDDNVFYLDGLVKWDEKFYEKKVKVMGKLMLREWKSDSTVQSMSGTQKIIKRPKWVVVD